MLAQSRMRQPGPRTRRYNNIYPNKYVYLYIGPATVLMLFMCLFPVLLLFYNAFTDLSLIRPQTRFMGLENFRRILLFNNEFRDNLLRTFVYAGSTVLFQVVFGFLIALLFQMRFPLRKAARAVMILPMVASPIAISFLWTIMLNPSMGIVNYLLGKLGLQGMMWLSSTQTALTSAIMVDIWQHTPFAFLIFSSAMTALSADPFEAAVVDGAGFWQMVRTVLMPMLKPVLTVVVLLKTVDGLKAFDLIYSMTGGGPVNATTTVNVMVYKDAFIHYEMGRASAEALVMYVIIFFIATLIVKKGGMGFN